MKLFAFIQLFSILVACVWASVPVVGRSHLSHVRSPLASSSPMGYQNVVKFEDDIFLHWSLLDSNGNVTTTASSATKISFALQGSVTGYVSFGLGVKNDMIGNQAIIAWHDPTKTPATHAATYNLNSESVSGVKRVDGKTADSADAELTDTSSTEEDGVTIVKFTRSLVPSSSAYNTFSATTSNRLVWACHNTANYLTEHTDEDTKTVNFGGSYQEYDSSYVPPDPDETATSPVTAAVGPSPLGYQSVADMSGSQQFFMHWTLTDSNGNPGTRATATHIDVALEGLTTGWVSIALSPSGGMVGSQAILGWVSGSTTHLATYDLEGTSTSNIVRVDGKSSTAADTELEIIDGSETDGVTTIRFRRALNPSSSGYVTFDPAASATYLYALGDEDKIQEHTQFGPRTMDLNTDVDEYPDENNGATSSVVVNDYMYSADYGKMIVHWTPLDNEIAMMFECSTSGWCALGLDVDSEWAMVGAQSIYTWVTSTGTVELAHYNLDGETSSKVKRVDGKSTYSADAFLTDVQGWQVDGKTFVSFTRKWDTGDSSYYTIKKDSYNRIIWAAGGSDSVVEHNTKSDRGESINFSTGESKSEGVIIAWQVAHGIMMVIGWAILVPWGIILARFYKHKDPWWFKMHRNVQYSAMLIVLAAFILGLVEEPEIGAHGGIGIVAVGLGLLQPINAYFRPKKGEQYRVPWEYLHKFSGRIGLILAIINLFIGLAIVDANMGLPIALGVWLFVGLVFALYRERLLQSKSAPAKPQDLKETQMLA
eukprot:TRINITY_DN1695_c0_g1::TRINITY_DN1695_c0_g1_i1::g.17635::m.17635 TRINITY_DN1695_c0_g1::TRINITY_DN1695_c0_g1_i1::g.17635  ORF type:complete len:767 (+),score=229.69,sp/Q9M363/B561I_ARATH/27.15/4e-27,DOMON/PF03351.12/8.1e-14,DOMON/PF03351.12/4.2e-14,DOMON/PF03351.12/3.5e-14,Cytochrom_B561/PF03188.11/0.00022,DUF568/PF04526.8/0.28,DUF568/PF04526.8/37,DUF568/PF04526.8/76,DUF568/PF04526.8/6.6e+03,SdpI/PF13630.1/6.2e+02,SdpI/PF13630.1/0.027,ABC2_membrane_4/PF12730.2/6.1 TRINITY_DN1695_c0_g1_i1:150-2450(